MMRIDYEITVDGKVLDETFVGAVGAVKRARKIALENPEATVQMTEILAKEGETKRELLYSATGGGFAGGGHEAVVGDL
jgi:hypothetical protein